MDIEEMKERKEIMRHAILEEILQFEGDTGMRIPSIDLHHDVILGKTIAIEITVELL